MRISLTHKMFILLGILSLGLVPCNIDAQAVTSAPQAGLDFYSILNRTAFRMSGGVSSPAVDINFHRSGTLRGEPAYVSSYGLQNEPHAACSFGWRYAVHESVVLQADFDYNVIPMEGMDLQIRTTDPKIISITGSCLIHHFSGFFGLEFRHPVKMHGGGGVLSPYCQVGIGIRGGFSSCPRFELDDPVAFGGFVGGGFEFFMENVKEYSLFIDFRLYHTFGDQDVALKPTSTSMLKGSIQISLLAIFFGVNFYID